MKKLLSLIFLVFVIMFFGLFSNASGSTTITLLPGWNVVSTPEELSSMSFSGGRDINIYVFENNKRKPIAITDDFLLEPLQGYLISNNGSRDITLQLNYKPINSAQSTFQKNVKAGWNLLGISTTNAPFSSITDSNGMIIRDLTWTLDIGDGGGVTHNYSNHVTRHSFYLFSDIKRLYNDNQGYQLGEAYPVYMENKGVYSYTKPPIDCDDPVIALACSLGDEECPLEACGYIIVKSDNATLPRTVLRGTNNVIILTGGVIRLKKAIETSFTITANSVGITSMKLIINDSDEYVGLRTEVGNKAKFRFNNIDFQPNDKFSFIVDIADDYNLYGLNIGFSGGNDFFSEAKYLDNNIPIDDEIIRDFSFINLEIKPVTLTIAKKIVDINGSNTARTFYENDDTTKTFEVLTSTCKVSEIPFLGGSNIDSIYIDGTEYNGNDIKFTVNLCTESIGPASYYFHKYLCETIGEITSIGEAGKINIEPIHLGNPELQVNVTMNTKNVHTYDDLYIVVNGKDHFGHDIGPASEKLATFGVIEKVYAHLIVSSDYTSVIRIPNQNEMIGTFKVASSNEEDDTLLFREFILSGNINGNKITSNDITVSEGYYVAESGSGLIYKTSGGLTNNGKTITIGLKNEVVGIVDLELVSVNGETQGILFNNKFTNSILKPNFGRYYTHHLHTETKTANAVIKNVNFYFDDDTNFVHDGIIEDGYDIVIASKVYPVDVHVNKITYDLIIDNNVIHETVTPNDFGLTGWTFPTNRSADMQSALAYHELADYVVKFAGSEDKQGSTKFTFWSTEGNDATITNVNLVFGDNTYTIDNMHNGDTYEIDALGDEPVYLTEYSRTVTKGTKTKTFRLTYKNNWSLLKIGGETVKIFGTN